MIDRTHDLAKYGLVPQGENIVLLSPSEEISMKMVIRSEMQMKDADNNPEGYATVSLQDSKGILPGTTRQVKLPLTKDAKGNYVKEIIYQIPGEVLADRDSELKAVATFRGHTYQQPFLLRAAGGLKVDFSPYVYRPPSIMLSGPRKRRASGGSDLRLFAQHERNDQA